jgi:hypothetical protein
MTEKEAKKLQEIMYAQHQWFKKTEINLRVLYRVFENYEFNEIAELVLELLRQPDRTFPPTTNDIFKLKRDKLISKPVTFEEVKDHETKADIINKMHEQFPELFN